MKTTIKTREERKRSINAWTAVAPRILLAVAITLLAAACQSEGATADTDGEATALQIASATFVPTDDVSVEVGTRATAAETPITSGSIGIFRTQEAGYNTELNNIPYTCDGNTFVWQPTAAANTVWLHGDDVNVCAYYPYTASIPELNYDDKTQMPIRSGKYTGTTTLHGQEDFCYAINRTVNAAKRTTSFQMVHAMALLELSVTADANFKGEGNIKGVILENTNLITRSTINITGGTYSDSPEKGLVENNTDATIGGATPQLKTLLVPFTPAEPGLSVNLSMDGIRYEAVITTAQVREFEAGNRYSVKLTVAGTDLKVTGVDCLPWDEEGVGGDDYTYYPEKEKPDYIEIGGVKWAKANLLTDGVLAASPEAYGGYFGWNVLDNGYGSQNTGEYNYAQDPCKALAPAGTWQTPTDEQLRKLTLAENRAPGGIEITINGTKYTTDARGWISAPANIKDQGQVFGTAANFLFLPAAGYRYGDGTTNSVGTYGDYWSRTPYDSDYAYELYFGSSTCYINNTNRPYGQSVRCVKVI